MPVNPSPQVEPVVWRGGALRFLDQTLLPGEERYVETDDYRVVAHAIRRLAVRGAPLIGIAAAYGIALAATRGDDIGAAADELAETRPTAVNLRWAVGRLLALPSHGAPAFEAEARRIHDEQRAADAVMGQLGAPLISDGATVLTHCNAGALATGGIGTALAPIKTAHWAGQRVRALVDETRPLLQGARLTAWELGREGIPHDVIVDSAAAGLIAQGRVQAVFVGADRIATNGDVANKVGTYGVALAAQAHDVPFYVVAPASTIDRDTRDGAAIEIEQRDAHEVLAACGTAAGGSALNPAFDVTPSALVTAIITEAGMLRAPYGDAIDSMRQPVAVRR